MSNVARRRLGIVAEEQSNKNQHLPTHEFHIGQDIMCQSPITKRWFPVKIKALCPELRSYQIETPEGITYRRTQNHLKPFQLCQNTQTKDQHKEQCHKGTLIQSDFTKIPLHQKRQIKVPLKLNL